jgi:hypothetical protein
MEELPKVFARSEGWEFAENDDGLAKEGRR